MANKNFDFVPVYQPDVYREWLAEQDADVIQMNSAMWNRIHLQLVKEVYEARKKFFETCGEEVESFESFQLVAYVAHAYHAMEDSIVRSEIEEMTKVGK